MAHLESSGRSARFRCRKPQETNIDHSDLAFEIAARWALRCLSWVRYGQDLRRDRKEACAAESCVVAQRLVGDHVPEHIGQSSDLRNLVQSRCCRRGEHVFQEAVALSGGCGCYSLWEYSCPFGLADQDRPKWLRQRAEQAVLRIFEHVSHDLTLIALDANANKQQMIPSSSPNRPKSDLPAQLVALHRPYPQYSS